MTRPNWARREGRACRALRLVVVLLAVAAVCTAILARSGRISLPRPKVPGRILQGSPGVIERCSNGLRRALGSKEGYLREQLRIQEASAAAARGATSRLASEVSELVLERTQLQDAQAVGREKIARLESQLEEEHTSSKASVSKLQSELEKEHAAVQAKVSEATELAAERAASRERVAQLESQLEAQRTSGTTCVSKLESELKKERAAVQALEERAAAAERRAEELASEPSASRERLAKLESHLEKERESGRSIASKLEAEMANMRAAVRVEEERAAAAERRAEELVSERAAGRDRVAQLESQLEEERTSGTTCVSKLESELKKERAAALAQEERAAAAERRAEELAGERAAGRDRVAQLESQLEEERTSGRTFVSKLESELSNERAKIRGEDERAVAAERTAEVLAAEVARLTSALDEAVNIAEALRAEAEILTSELEAERSAGQELKAQSAAMQASYAELNDRYEDSQSLQAKAMEERKLLSIEIPEENAKMVILSDLLAQKTSQLEVVEARMNTIHGALNAAVGAFANKFKKHKKQTVSNPNKKIAP